MASPDEEDLIREKSDSLQWVPITLSFVEYPRGDWLGKCFALISLVPCGVVSGMITLILFRRDLHTIFFFLGTLLNELVNFGMKNLIAEERPMLRTGLYTEYGMPSGHSQFSWFFTSYVVCFILIRLHHMNNNSTLESVWKLVIIFGCVLLSSLICIGRVYLQYHTWAQVLAGFFVGSFVGIIWFTITHFFLTPYFPMIVSWRISELLLIRDTTLIPNVLWFEYTNARQESRARSRKLVSMKSQ